MTSTNIFFLPLFTQHFSVWMLLCENSVYLTQAMLWYLCFSLFWRIHKILCCIRSSQTKVEQRLGWVAHKASSLTEELLMLTVVGKEDSFFLGSVITGCLCSSGCSMHIGTTLIGLSVLFFLKREVTWGWEGDVLGETQGKLEGNNGY